MVVSLLIRRQVENGTTESRRETAMKIHDFAKLKILLLLVNGRTANCVGRPGGEAQQEGGQGG